MSSALYLQLGSETLQSLQPTFMSPDCSTNIITNLRSVTLTSQAYEVFSQDSYTYITFISNQILKYPSQKNSLKYFNLAYRRWDRWIVLFIIEEVNWSGDNVLAGMSGVENNHFIIPHNNNNNNNNTSLAAWVGLLTPL